MKTTFIFVVVSLALMVGANAFSIMGPMDVEFYERQRQENTGEVIPEQENPETAKQIKLNTLEENVKEADAKIEQQPENKDRKWNVIGKHLLRIIDSDNQQFLMDRF